MDQNMQSLQCKVCQKVTLADGSQVWVCKECGEEHAPGEGVVVDQAMQAEVSAAAAQMPPVSPTTPATPVAESPAAPAAGTPTDTTNQ